MQFFKRLLIETIENKQLNLDWGLSDCLEYDETQTLITEITNEVGLNQDVSVETELKYAQLFFTLSQTSVYLQKKIIVPSTVPALQLGAAFYFSLPTEKQMMESVLFKSHKSFCESFFLELCCNTVASSILTT